MYGEASCCAACRITGQGEAPCVKAKPHVSRRSLVSTARRAAHVVRRTVCMVRRTARVMPELARAEGSRPSSGAGTCACACDQRSWSFPEFRNAIRHTFGVFPVCKFARCSQRSCRACVCCARFADPLQLRCNFLPRPARVVLLYNITRHSKRRFNLWHTFPPIFINSASRRASFAIGLWRRAIGSGSLRSASR